MDDDRDEGLARRTDPWSSQEIEDIIVSLQLLEAILVWLPVRRVRACGGMCRYAADFEITAAMLPFFPEVYEGEIRRHMRILRKRDPRVVTLPRVQHFHVNPDTGRRQQCHAVLPRRRKTGRAYGDPA